MSSKQTPSQTVGPFFSFGLTPTQYGYAFASLAGPELDIGATEGPAICIEGNVYDGTGTSVPDALIEIWQADQQGRYAHPADSRSSNVGFVGYARMGTGTEADAKFRFRTIKPGVVAAGQAPHINVCLFMRGLLNHVYTRIYFDDEAAANDNDPVLTSVSVERRQTLIAKRISDAAYEFDIYMQGKNETVFFDV